MKCWNVYYKGSYIGYVVAGDYENEESIIVWLTHRFGLKFSYDCDWESKWDELKANLTLKPKDKYPGDKFFKRQVFDNIPLLGDDFGFTY